MKFPIVTIAGGSCSGKTTFVEGFKNAVIISIDSFYKDISDLTPDREGKYDFDTPEAIDMMACRQAAIDLSEGKEVQVPIYDYVSAKRTGESVVLPPKDGGIVVVEGIFALHPPLHDLGMVRIFIEAPPEIRIARRVKRDTAKGRSPAETLAWFVKVEAGHQKYIEPTKQYANLVIPFSNSPLIFSP